MVYESANKFPSKESDLSSIPMPKTSYGFSKLVGEFYCKAYFDQYGLNYTIIRPFNAYGPGEYPADEPGLAHVIPDLLKKVFYGKTPINLLGNGKQVRCFTHVDDIARAIVISMNHKRSLNQDFNIANQDPIRIDDLLKLIWKLSGKNSKLKIRHLKGLEGDVQKRVPDVSKAYRLLNWRPIYTLETGLSDVINWFLQNYKDSNRNKK